MPLRTVSNTGGNWSSTAAWVGGVVPIVGDTVDFTATSGNLTVDVSTASLGGIDFSNYVGTITFTSSINTNGNVNIGTGGYTQAGTGGLNINAATTISGSTVWSRRLTFGGTGITYTLGSNLTVTGNITFNGTTTSTFNGNTLNIEGNLTVTSTATVSGTTAFVFNGTGTWNHTTSGVIRNNVTINTAGTLTIGTNIYYNTGTLTYTAGTVITTGSTLNIGASTTLDTSGITWNNVIITAGTQTLTSDLNCKNLTNDTVTINGLFNVNVNGNLTATGITQIGTSTIVLIGTGLWTALNGSNNFRAPIIINTNGIITLANILYHEGNLTYIKGTVKSDNTTITFAGNTLINLNKLNFKNVIIGAGTTITMNEFFSGSPSLKTNISSTGANYNISFQDNFEKIAKFVNITRATITKRNQLLVITDSKKSSSNIGIRYINQSPNSISKNDASIQNTMTNGLTNFLINDPTMIIK